MKYYVYAFSFFVCCAAIATQIPLRKAIQHDAASMVFVDAPSLPSGTKIAVLEGDPKGTGMFTIRLLLPKGFALPLHAHPSDERVTVMSGSVVVDIEGKARTFGAGAFYVNPAGAPHTVKSDEGATLQITGAAPWKVDLLTTSTETSQSSTKTSP